MQGSLTFDCSLVTVLAAAAVFDLQLTPLLRRRQPVTNQQTKFDESDWRSSKQPQLHPPPLQQLRPQL